MTRVEYIHVAMDSRGVWYAKTKPEILGFWCLLYNNMKRTATAGLLDGQARYWLEMHRKRSTVTRGPEYLIRDFYIDQEVEVVIHQKEIENFFGRPEDLF